MKTKIRFMVYNAFGIGGTVKTIFNFANYFYATNEYDVEIISIKKTRETPILYLNPKIEISYFQDSRKSAKFSEEERNLLNQPSELIHKEEDLYMMFNAYTDVKLEEIFTKMHDGVLVTTMPSLNMLSAKMVDESVLKIGQEHKSYADHASGLQLLIRENYGKLDALTILTEKNKHIYERKIRGNVPIYVLGNGTERLPYRVNLKNHIIVAAGRYAEQKGYDMLIKAFALIAKKYPDWIVKIYGEGSLAQSYIETIHKYNLENRIILEPGSENMNEKLSEASIHVCSSYYEPFGMVIIEGFAMGLPCISFACDGPTEIITNGYDGVIVPKEDIVTLANAMASIMGDEELRADLGKNAYETAKKYDIEVIGENLHKIIKREMKNKIQEIFTNVEDVKNKLVDPEEKLEMVNIDYSELIHIAADGKIGLRTLLEMLKYWLRYKLYHKKYK